MIQRTENCLWPLGHACWTRAEKRKECLLSGWGVHRPLGRGVALATQTTPKYTGFKKVLVVPHNSVGPACVSLIWASLAALCLVMAWLGMGGRGWCNRTVACRRSPHHSFLGARECVTLPGRRNFAHVIETLGSGDDTELSVWTQSNLMSPWKQRRKADRSVSEMQW